MDKAKLTKALYSVKEAASILGLTDDVIRTMIKQKQLDGMKTGFQWRIKRASIEKYL